MLNILKSKIIIYFAIFGAAFSFLLALFSGVSVVWLFIRILAGGILMGALGFGLDFFLRQSLSDEDYKSLFSKAPRSDSPTAQEGVKNLDVIDDTGLSPEDEYKNMYSEESARKDGPVGGLSGVPDTNSYAPPSFQQDVPLEPPPLDADTRKNPANEFREDDLTAAPRVTQKPFPMDDDISANSNPAQNELAKMESAGIPFKTKEPSSSMGSDGSVKFSVGNKKITADPKVIAKAIKTVLQRDK